MSFLYYTWYFRFRLFSIKIKNIWCVSLCANRVHNYIKNGTDRVRATTEKCLDDNRFAKNVRSTWLRRAKLKRDEFSLAQQITNLNLHGNRFQMNLPQFRHRIEHKCKRPAAGNPLRRKYGWNSVSPWPWLRALFITEPNKITNANYTGRRLQNKWKTNDPLYLNSHCHESNFVTLFSYKTTYPSYLTWSYEHLYTDDDSYTTVDARRTIRKRRVCSYELAERWKLEVHLDQFNLPEITLAPDETGITVCE